MTLQDALLAAHARGDAGELVRLYQQAADEAETEAQAGFFLTHAYVFALEIGHPDAKRLRAKLEAAGRELPLQPAKPPLR